MSSRPGSLGGWGNPPTRDNFSSCKQSPSQAVHQGSTFLAYRIIGDVTLPRLPLSTFLVMSLNTKEADQKEDAKELYIKSNSIRQGRERG